LVGTACLTLLPCYMWYKIFKIRSKGHEHLPDWHSLVTAVVFASSAVALLNPVIAFFPGYGIDQVGIEKVPAVTPYVFAVIVALLVFLIGIMNKYANKLLMVGPFLAGLIFYGFYIYYNFLSLFLYGANAVLRYMDTNQYAVPVVIFVSFATIVFYVTGYLSFLYEIWRD